LQALARARNSRDERVETETKGREKVSKTRDGQGAFYEVIASQRLALPFAAQQTKR
jgi:hypothetical protein